MAHGVFRAHRYGPDIRPYSKRSWTPSVRRHQPAVLEEVNGTPFRYHGFGISMNNIGDPRAYRRNNLGTLNTAEVDEFLSQPRTAQLVTVYATGTPHVAPVWFLWDNGRALVMADRAAVKVRNIHRNSAVALCVPTADHPYSFVTIEGTAEVTDRGLDDMVRRTCVLYEGEGRGAEFAAELLAEERLTLIVISPGRFISWKEDEE